MMAIYLDPRHETKATTVESGSPHSCQGGSVKRKERHEKKKAQILKQNVWTMYGPCGEHEYRDVSVKLSSPVRPYRVPSLGSSLYLHSTGLGCYPEDTLQGFQSALVASTADGGGHKFRG